MISTMSEPETPPDAQEKQDEEHWTVRRQRMVQCKIHGLHYDPRLTSGCAKCRKEGLIAAPPREKPQFLPLLLLILAIVLVVYGVFLPGFRAQRGGAEEELVPETYTAHKLDPESFREAIATVETALYENPANDLGMMTDDARHALATLAGDLRLSPHQIGRQAAVELDLLSGRLPQESATIEVFEGVRSQWPSFRTRYFSPVPWFRRAVVGDPGDDRVTLAVYRDVAAELMALVDEGLGRIEELSQPSVGYTVDQEDEARKIREWRSYRQEWLGRLEELRARLPARPGAETDTEVLMATQNLEVAFSQATSLAETQPGSGVASRFEAAFSLTEKAHRSFDDILLR